MSVPVRKRPGFPEPIGKFKRLAPTHYRAVVRRAQGFSAKQTATELGISSKTAEKYLERARKKIGGPGETTQDMIWDFYQTYAPGMWPEAQEDDDD